ncbi:hypothetical protein F2Q69_00056491 [Brassica cretica]|uniref:Uncharacterized protein n=1 Tax=Brassica cretica TaxID=69181 RepID=A0A8S9MWI9_BRACR|nr:hypothetical protein F2Q69_00056491 [Brassica cretica]
MKLFKLCIPYLPADVGDEEYHNNMWGHTQMPTLLRSTQTSMTSADSMLHNREDMSYQEYVEIHSRCMRQLGLPVRFVMFFLLVLSCSTITCLQVKQMMGPGNHLGQQSHGFWAKSGLCSNTLKNCSNQLNVYEDMFYKFA